jgi:5-bromo-4-chloroindolyl phosphate hydrolysis protein
MVESRQAEMELREQAADLEEKILTLKQEVEINQGIDDDLAEAYEDEVEQLSQELDEVNRKIE